jgi:hypothetical protein
LHFNTLPKLAFEIKIKFEEEEEEVVISKVDKI